MIWNNKVRNLASRNAGRLILMDLDNEPRALNQARFTTDGTTLKVSKDTHLDEPC